MKKNVKQNFTVFRTYRRQDSDRIPLEMCLEINIYSFIYKNKQWTVVFRKQNINLLG